MTVISKVIKELGVTSDQAVNIRGDNQALMSLIDKSPTLKEYYIAGNIKNMVWTGDMENWFGEFIYGTGDFRTVFFNTNRISTYRVLITTALHEFRHGWQYASGLVSRLQNNGYGYASNKYSRTSYFMEYDAYQSAINYGSSWSISIDGRDMYLNKFINYPK